MARILVKITLKSCLSVFVLFVQASVVFINRLPIFLPSVVSTIGKNYLSEQEIKQLERAVSNFFDYIEGIIERRNTFDMQSFAESVDKFLAFNEYKILEGFGKVTRKQANQKAFVEYEKFK